MRVLGIDPGLTRCGVGVVEGAIGRPLSMVDVGVVRTGPEVPVEERLLLVAVGIEEWIDRVRPDAVAVERVFAQANVRTVMGTAQVSGLALVEMLRPNYAWAIQVPENDPAIHAETVSVPSPQGNGHIDGYLVRPAGARGKRVLEAKGILLGWSRGRAVTLERELERAWKAFRTAERFW